MVMKHFIENSEGDRIILVSGDGDYWKMVNYLITTDRFEKLLAPNKKGTSSLYKRIPDRFIAYLDDQQIKKKIEHNKTGSP